MGVNLSFMVSSQTSSKGNFSFEAVILNHRLAVSNGGPNFCDFFVLCRFASCKLGKSSCLNLGGEDEELLYQTFFFPQTPTPTSFTEPSRASIGETMDTKSRPDGFDDAIITIDASHELAEVLPSTTIAVERFSLRPTSKLYDVLICIVFYNEIYFS
jgi:hypothetical protein